MTAVELFGWFEAGIMLSLFVPIATRALKTFVQATTKKGARWQRFWAFAKPYVGVAVASAVLAFFLLVVYKAGDQQFIDNWAKAVLFGYAWDSTVQKIVNGVTDPDKTGDRPLPKDRPLLEPGNEPPG
jgi:hypothetical protein